MNPAKEYLLQLAEIEHRLRRIAWESADIRARLGIHGIRYDGDRVQTSAGDPMAELFAYLDETERKAGKVIAELKRKRAVIEYQLTALPDKYGELLHLRYCRGYRLRRVADVMGYSQDHVRRMHREALDAFAELYQAEIAAYLAGKGGKQ